MNNPFSRNVITTLYMVFLTSVNLQLHLNIRVFGTIKKPPLEVSKKQFETWSKAIWKTWFQAIKNKNVNENSKVLTDTSMNTFRNYILYVNQKVENKTPEWVKKD